MLEETIRQLQQDNTQKAAMDATETVWKKLLADVTGNMVKVQMLEETIRQLQQDNTQMRARVEIEMQVQVQRQVEREVQEHMRQQELEAYAREEAREREWQRKMDDINSLLRKINDPHPPQ
nr:transposase, Ptta/En/Spm [Tanacetum cinerariifolium]